MGASDFQSILGNRDGAQGGYNFDMCNTQHRKNREKSLLMYRDLETGELKTIKSAFECERGSSRDLYMCEMIHDYDEEGHIYLESAELILEILLICKNDVNKTGYKKDKEKDFMNDLYPHVIDRKFERAVANAGDWELCFVDNRNWKIEYFHVDPIFRLGPHLENIGDGIIPTPEDFFGYIDEGYQVWVRTWYAQIYEALFERDLSLISDECLFHVAGELGVKNAEKVKIGKLFQWCCDTFHRRYM